MSWKERLRQHVHLRLVVSPTAKRESTILLLTIGTRKNRFVVAYVQRAGVLQLAYMCVCLHCTSLHFTQALQLNLGKNKCNMCTMYAAHSSFMCVTVGNRTVHLVGA